MLDDYIDYAAGTYHMHVGAKELSGRLSFEARSSKLDGVRNRNRSLDAPFSPTPPKFDAHTYIYACTFYVTANGAPCIESLSRQSCV